jgi:hypothetical protein
MESMPCAYTNEDHGHIQFVFSFVMETFLMLLRNVGHYSREKEPSLGMYSNFILSIDNCEKEGRFRVCPHNPRALSGGAETSTGTVYSTPLDRQATMWCKLKSVLYSAHSAPRAWRLEYGAARLPLLSSTPSLPLSSIYLID